MDVLSRFSLLKACLVIWVLGATGCASTQSPMPMLSYTGPQSDGKTLIVALRGIGGTVKSFEKYHFVSDLHRHYPSFDVMIPDAHFGYYKEKSLLNRLEEDVFNPARKQGYEKIWLVGISLGGLGSLINLQCCEAEFAGAVLIAPYSGESELHQEIEAYLAGSASSPWESARWQEEDSKDFLALWAWILDNGALFSSGNIWLGYGDKDRLSGHELLASRLPDKNVIRVKGGHKAKVFSSIWNDILEQKPF